MEMNIFAPIPAPIHIIFCVLATIFFAYMVIKYKRIHHIFLTIAIDITLLTQLVDKYEYIQILGYIEIILCAITLFFYFKQKRSFKAISKSESEVLKEDISDYEQGE